MGLDRKYLLVLICLVFAIKAVAQDIERARPEEWNELVQGGRFMDRFLPIPTIGELTSKTWGCEAVLPRYTDNGIEDNSWSYWGGNIMKLNDGKYHMIVCRWPEAAEKGHMEWPNSEIAHAVSNQSLGPYKVKGETIGKGHNPEFFALKDGRYVIYVVDAYYIAEKIDGQWQKSAFDFDSRDRKIIDGLSNVSFTQREDGSYLAVCRGGGIWVSETGISPYCQVTNTTVYPPFDGRYEDPVIWKTNIQYHMIVNDWYGRIAYYLRSKDGINWKVEPGEAYMPGIARYEDGTVEDWYKFERIKVLQDEYGRAYQANFAVIDSSKWHDKGNDHHSSKNISIPLIKGRLLTILNKKQITPKTSEIQVLIEAEQGFNPHEDIDIESLRFGASEEVNFGRGGKSLKTEKKGNDMVVYFQGQGNGLSEKNFVAKLIGKTTTGKLLFGYARLPGLQYSDPILSARKPIITREEYKTNIEFEVQNFGGVDSDNTSVILVFTTGEKTVKVFGKVPALKPYQKTNVSIREKLALDSAPEHVEILVEKGQKMPLFVQD